MGSHYIQVGKLKIDQDFLDIVCPAAGYIDPNAPEPPYIAPVDTGEPEQAQIILLCSDAKADTTSFRVICTPAGSYVVNVYTAGGSFLDTQTITGGGLYSYTFPTFNAGAHYIVKINPATAGSDISRFYIQTYGYISVIQAKFNTPGLTSMASAFSNCVNLREIIFYSTLNSLTTFASAFTYTDLVSFTFPASLPALTTMDKIFQYSNVRMVDFNNSNMPLLSIMTYVLDRCSYLHTLICNPIVPSLTNFRYFIQYNNSLKEVILDFDLPASYFNLASFAQYCPILETLVMPYGLEGSSASLDSFVTYSQKLKSVTFPGYWTCTNVSSIFRETNALEEIILDKYIKNFLFSSSYTPQKYVKKIVLPEVYSGPSLHCTSPSLNELSGLFTVSEDTQTFSVTSLLLKNINLPGVKVSFIIAGTYATPIKIESVEFDWAGSVFSALNPVIQMNGLLSATELDRIFTALPEVSGGIYGLDVRNNPGFATCTPAIAQAKGWTVTGA